VKEYTLEDRDFASWVTIVRTRDAIYRNRVKELYKFNLSARQTAVLNILLALGGEATPTEISWWGLREQNSTSNFLKRMERDGLVKRVKDLDRKNLIRVVITEKGREAVNNAKKLKVIHKIMSSISDDEHRQLRTILEKLWYKALKELGKDKRPVFPSLK